LLTGLTAFDDQTSTFIIPAGAGFEVVFCPGARSTNILATEKEQLDEVKNGQTPQNNGQIVGGFLKSLIARQH
jgi:beta-mannosidase